MRLAILCLFLAGLAACREAAPAPPASPDPSFAVSAEEACLRDGGRWTARGTSGGMICLRTPRDAGRACQAASDCEGLCLARSRTCAPVIPLFGCQDILDRTGTRVTVCTQ